MELKYSRFQEAPWFNPNNKPVVLIGGAGGIGSWLTVLLTRAGCDCHVYDFDVLEELNMAGQCFGHYSIGKSKVDALVDMVQLMCNETPNVYNEAVTEDTMTNNVVFSAFDNIAARKIMFLSWLKEHKGQNNAIFIDGRLLAEQLTTYCIKANDEDAIYDYLNNHLPDDSKIPDAPCAMKQTSHFAAGIADKMVRWFTNFLAGQGRNVPYKHEEFGPTGFTKQMMKAPERPKREDIFEREARLENFRDRLRERYREQNQREAEKWANNQLEEAKRSGILDELRAASYRQPFEPIAVDPIAIPPTDFEEAIRRMNETGISLVDPASDSFTIVEHLTSSEIVDRYSNILTDEQRAELLNISSGEGHDDGTQAMPDLITGTPGDMEIPAEAERLFFTPPYEENSIPTLPPIAEPPTTNTTDEQLPF